MTGVIFDLDGTLVNTEALCAMSIRAGGRALGWELREEELRRCVGRPWGAALAELASGRGERAAFEPLLEAVLSHYDQELEQHLEPVPGGAELIRSLLEVMPVGLVTGSTRSQLQRCLRFLGLEGRLHHTLAEGEYAPGKPHPAGYLQAMRALGLEPSLTLIFEDSEAGARSGLAAGARVVGVRGASPFPQDLGAIHAQIQDFLGLNPAWCLSQLSP